MPPLEPPRPVATTGHTRRAARSEQIPETATNSRPRLRPPPGLRNPNSNGIFRKNVDIHNGDLRHCRKSAGTGEPAPGHTDTRNAPNEKRPARCAGRFSPTVGTSGFEPLTSCLSSRRSKPTELCSRHKKTACVTVSGDFSLWELRDSNPRPSACKADALNQLS